MSTMIIFLVLFSFFSIGLIIFLAQLLACICCGHSYFSAETLFFPLFSWILLGFWRDFFLPSQVLLGFWEGSFLLVGVLLSFWESFLVFAFFSSEVLLLSNGPCSSGIYTPSNVSFPFKFESIVVALEVMSSKILKFLIWMTLFWPLMWTL